MDVTEFIARYWILIIFALAFISSFFKKRGNEPNGGSKRNTPAGMPPFGQTTLKPERRVEIPLDESPSTRMPRVSEELSRQPMSTVSHSSQPLLDQGRIEMSKPMAGEVGFGSPFNRSARSGKTDRVRANDGNTAPKKSKVNPLVQGIIWSEVLGPPRARNPHRSRRDRKSVV